MSDLDKDATLFCNIRNLLAGGTALDTITATRVTGEIMKMVQQRDTKPLTAEEFQQPTMVAAVDAAMVEMKNISPPLRRSDCERLVRAALGVYQKPSYTAEPAAYPLTEYQPGQWWLVSLKALMDNRLVNDDTIRAAKVALDFAANVFAQRSERLDEALVTFLAEHTCLNQDGLDDKSMKLSLILNYAANNPVPDEEIKEWFETGYLSPEDETELYKVFPQSK